MKKTLVEDAGLSPVGTLRHTLDYACNAPHDFDGVFRAVKKRLGIDAGKNLFDAVQAVNSFRDTYVAHQMKELTDVAVSEENLKHWVRTLAAGQIMSVRRAVRVGVGRRWGAGGARIRICA